MNTDQQLLANTSSQTTPEIPKENNKPVLPTNNRRWKQIFLIIFGTLLFLGISSMLIIPRINQDIFPSSSQQQIVTPPPAEKTPTPTPSPTPKPIPQGKVPFTISSNSKIGPSMRKGFIDPYDPKPGEQQKVQIHIAPPSTTASVVLRIQTDTKEHEYTFNKIDPVDGYETWEAVWTVPDDTYLYRYNATLTAVDATGEAKVDITLR